MNLKYIFKILDKDEWNNAKKNGNYPDSSQDLKDGYIHFSEEEQLHETLEKYNDKKENLILMPYEMNTPITNHFQMSSPLNIDRKNDFFLLGDLSNISYLSNKKKSKLIKEFDVPFSSEPLNLYEINFK